MDKSIYYILLLFFLASACVEENDVFEKNIIQTSESNLAITMLDYVTNTDSADVCFNLIYPIIFTTNKENNVTYLNQIALNEAVTFLSNDFFINAVLFPFDVKLRNGQLLTIANDTDLSNLLQNECEIPSFISRVFPDNDCLQYRYPIRIFENEKSIIVNSLNEIPDALSNLNNTNTFINYPITTTNGLVINNQFEHLVLLNICENNVTTPIIPENLCSEMNLNINTSNASNTLYNYTLENQNGTIESIKWFIDGMLIENQNDTVFDFRVVQNGVYEICAEATLLNCNTPIRVCTITAVSDIIQACSPNVELLIDKNELVPGNYRFTASYTSIDIEAVRYTWNIDTLPNGMSVDNPSNTFDFTFTEPGDFTVCVSINDINCPTNSFFLFDCESVIVTPEDLNP